MVYEHELVPGGKDIPVTFENCAIFAELMNDFLLEDMHLDSFSRFLIGLSMVCVGNLRPPEVRALLESQKEAFKRERKQKIAKRDYVFYRH